jgi:hypothetical protein
MHSCYYRDVTEIRGHGGKLGKKGGKHLIIPGKILTTTYTNIWLLLRNIVI